MEELKPQTPVPENTSEKITDKKLEKALSDAKKESISFGDKFKRILKKTAKHLLYASTVYAVSSIGFELKKRNQAEADYKNAKEMLAEYKNKNDTASYREKYEKAAKLFSSYQIGFLQKPEEFKEYVDDNLINFENSIDERHQSQYDLSEIVMIGLLRPVFSIRNPELFEKNEYRDSYIRKQKYISRFDDHPSRSYQGEEYLGGIKRKESTPIIIDEQKPITIEHGFGKNKTKDTVSAEHIKSIIDNTYPKGWFNKEVNNILITDDTTGLANSMAQSGISGTEAAHYSTFDKEMLLHVQSMKDNPNFLIEVLSHESGHANDWSCNEDLNAQERLDLLLNVQSRLHDTDRFVSSYVESIKTSDYAKSVEYFAEICGEYLSNGPKNMSPKDVKIVDFVLRKKDNGFDVVEAIAKRQRIMQEQVYKKPAVLFSTEGMALLDEVNKFLDKYHEVVNKYVNLGDKFELIINSNAKSLGYKNLQEVKDTIWYAINNNKDPMDLIVKTPDVLFNEYIKIYYNYNKTEIELDHLEKEFEKNTGISYWDAKNINSYEY